MRAIIIARLTAEARSLPLRNPGYASDAFLAFADILAEAAAELQHDDQPETALLLRALEERCRLTAPLHAPPLTAETATHILRRETT